ncbi:hypothetical protein PHMEG_00029009 [Phytophthora megakarya]|uniref:Uncharacterized protein n=1 Tax=Phytophthora megakarya TaxID=4795 RepID=A0A225V323_9STRA|nr:hypothetical protein PHMEG_00029009 [Phytophthora megakarya]
MEYLWGFDWERYADSSSWPMHCFTAVCVVGGWTMTTPYRAILWTFTCEVWRVFRLNTGMAAGVPVKVPATPTLVLTTEEQRYGRYGRMHRAWWNAWREALYEYLPDLIADTYCSMKNYYSASWDATKATAERAYAAGHALCWFVLLLSITLHEPVVVYDVLEYVCCTSLGLMVMLSAVNVMYWLFQ